MGKLKSVIGYVVMNALFAGVIYMATFENVQGWKNVAIALASVLCLMNLISLGTAKRYFKLGKVRRLQLAVPMFVDFMLDMVFALVLVYFGMFWTGGIWMLYGTAAYSMKEEIESLWLQVDLGKEQDPLQAAERRGI